MEEAEYMLGVITLLGRRYLKESYSGHLKWLRTREKLRGDLDYFGCGN